MSGPLVTMRKPISGRASVTPAACEASFTPRQIIGLLGVAETANLAPVAFSSVSRNSMAARLMDLGAAGSW